MNLTPHFTLEEMTATQTGLENEPGDDEIASLTALCTKVLEPLREQFEPIIIRSGFRSEAVNKRVGGVPDSQHRKGEAADFVCLNHNRKKLAEIAAWALENLPVDQVILEPGWVHISYGPRHRNQGLIWIGTNQYAPVTSPDDFRRA